MTLGRDPRPVLGARCTLLAWGWALRPLISSSSPPAGLGQQLSPRLGCMCLAPPLGTTISWHWQEQHPALPGHSAPSAPLTGPERDRGAPWAGCSLGCLALGLTASLLVAGCAPGRGCGESSCFCMSGPGRAVLVCGEHPDLQGRCQPGVHLPSPPRSPSATKGSPCPAAAQLSLGQRVQPKAVWLSG